MSFFADLHIHSKYSRATARDCDLENLSIWAQKKGISVVATGDFTHPVWRAELKDKLVADGSGLFSLRDDLRSKVNGAVPASCRGDVRFMLSVEISTIYKKGEKTRKVHHVVFVPSLDAADRLAAALARIGNIASDGRPILGLDSRNLLEIVLESDPSSFLIPAHIWTPWFSALGSKSGFDSIDDCYGDLAQHIFAVETGLSSDPAMNWRVSSLDRFRLVSNSDAHSPHKLGREACIFDCELTYGALLGALKTGSGYVGTVEFFPEEGKYHADGHRKCNVRLDPKETRALKDICPECGRPVTVGVLNRVEELAGREEGCAAPATGGKVVSLIPFAEIIAEIRDAGAATKGVISLYEGLLARLGPELKLLSEISIDEIRSKGNSILAEAILRLREGRVIREAGYDGEYGVIKLFAEDELGGKAKERLLFDDLPNTVSAVAGGHGVGWCRTGDPHLTPAAAQDVRRSLVIDAAMPQMGVAGDRTRRHDPAAAKEAADILSTLDPDQRVAAEHAGGPLLITAGPGSGKTRTLTHRIANLITRHAVPPAHFLAITFTRRTAAELGERLKRLLPDAWKDVSIHTFHSLGLSILQAHGSLAGLSKDFRVADAEERTQLLSSALAISQKKAESLLERISVCKRTGKVADDELGSALAAYSRMLSDRNLIDFDDLIAMPIRILRENESVLDEYRSRYQWISIDEYQDIDERQYELVGLLAPAGANICAIGDPDQAIYGFRGSDAGFFHRFTQDYPGAVEIGLSRNYRSIRTIVDASAQVVASASSSSLIPQALADSPERIVIHESPTDKAEAEFVVSAIEKLIGGHSFFSIDSGRGDSGGQPDLSFSDIAVLYRTNAQSDVMCEALSRSGIPFQRFSSSEQSHDLDPRAERVSLLTLHAAKGLEFKAVFIAGCEDGIIPLKFGGAEAEDIDEERRLFYVGMTRAMERLFLCRASRRLVHGKPRDMQLSPFLADIEKELTELQKTALKRRPSDDRKKQIKLF